MRVQESDFNFSLVMEGSILTKDQMWILQAMDKIVSQFRERSFG